jgi:hypothetical protein
MDFNVQAAQIRGSEDKEHKLSKHAYGVASGLACAASTRGELVLGSTGQQRSCAVCDVAAFHCLWPSVAGPGGG